jgi:predicted aconitase
LKTTPEEVVEMIARLAKKGMTPSQIGVILRDSHGVAQVKNVTGNKILRILKSNGVYLLCCSCLFVSSLSALVDLCHPTHVPSVSMHF